MLLIDYNTRGQGNVAEKHMIKEVKYILTAENASRDGEQVGFVFWCWPSSVPYSSDQVDGEKRGPRLQDDCPLFCTTFSSFTCIPSLAYVLSVGHFE